MLPAPLRTIWWKIQQVHILDLHLHILDLHPQLCSSPLTCASNLLVFTPHPRYRYPWLRIHERIHDPRFCANSRCELCSSLFILDANSLLLLDAIFS